MGTKENPWGTKPIKDQTQEEFEAHYRENRQRERREAEERSRQRGGK